MCLPYLEMLVSLSKLPLYPLNATAMTSLLILAFLFVQAKRKNILHAIIICNYLSYLEDIMFIPIEQ